MKLKNIFKRFLKSERGASAVVGIVTALLTTYSAYVFIFINAEDEKQNQRDIHLYNAYQMASALEYSLPADCAVDAAYSKCLDQSMYNGLTKDMAELEASYRLNSNFSDSETYTIYDRTASVDSEDTEYDKENSTVTIVFNVASTANASTITGLVETQISETDSIVTEILYLVNLAGTANSEENHPYPDNTPFYYLVMNDSLGNTTDNNSEFDGTEEGSMSALHSYASEDVILLPLDRDPETTSAILTIDPAEGTYTP